MDSPEEGGREGDLKLRDLSEFCENWPDRKEAFLLACKGNFPANSDTRETAYWLSVLADKTFKFEVQ